ncbi:MAG: DUF3426 domain-containing protein [Pseudomonadota bacterium]|nr:DUF3426 domain-containing protein [Pseudomonadota bacterium]
MFVPCPHCGYSLALTDADENVTQRCPRCEGLLTPVSSDPLPQAAAASAGQANTPEDEFQGTADPEDPVATLIAAESAAAIAPAAASIPGTSATAPAARPRRRGSGAPSFVRNPHPAIPLGPRWPGLLVIAALALLLAIQLLLVQHEVLAGNERWRPAIGRACAILPCDLPPWRQPSAITMLDRSVQPQPGRPGVLAVRASFRNDAAWPQPWPELLLSLADVDGRPVAQGVFDPAEYGSTAEPQALLAPGETATVRFAVREPDPRTVAFTFEFR